MLESLDKKSEGITWVSTQSLIQQRKHASKRLLSTSKIQAKNSGGYQSAFKGRGMEFDESRIYQAGDDIRNMDWRVTARTGKPHSKIFCEEKERPVLLWLDLSASMMFATQNKFKAVIATELACLIGWSAEKNNDKVGGLIFSDDQHFELKPKQGKTAVMQLIRRCAQFRTWHSQTKKVTESTANISNISAITRLQKVTHPGSLIFMLSDFTHFGQKNYHHLANIARNNDIVLIKISDPIESNLPPAGNYQLTNNKINFTLNTSNKKNRQSYQKRFDDNNQTLANFCRQHRIHKMDICTTHNAIEKLKSNLGLQKSGLQN